MIHFLQKCLSQPDELRYKLASEIEAITSVETQNESREAFANALAQGLTRSLPNILGAVVILCDQQGIPLTYGSQKIDLQDGQDSLHEWVQLVARVHENAKNNTTKKGPHGTLWIEIGIDNKILHLDDPDRIRSTLLISDGNILGTLLVETRKSWRATADLDAISFNDRHIISAIHSLNRAQQRSSQVAEKYNRLLSLLGNMGIAYFRTDARGLRTLEASTLEEMMTGYLPNQLGSGGNLTRDKIYVDHQRYNALLRSAEAQERDAIINDVFTIKKNDGGSLFVRQAFHAIMDVEGKIHGFEGVYKDISSLIELQQFLDVETPGTLDETELYKKLDKAVKYYITLISSIAHQLKTPMGATVDNFRNVIDGVVDSEKFNTNASYLMGQLRVCAQLIASLTHMEKMLRDEHITFHQVEVNPLIDNIVAGFSHLAAEKNIKIVVRQPVIPSNLEIWGHKELLRHVFIILVDNAVKYSKRDSVLRIVNLGGRAMQISNSGLPVREHHREKIFERGFRTIHASAWIPDGTGLGLWLARRILTAHDATIKCSEVLEGDEERVVFNIEFPKEAVLGSVQRSVS